MKLSELKAGDKVVAHGIPCVTDGEQVVQSDYRGIFISCAHGQHYLDGQEGDDGELIGIRRV